MISSTKHINKKFISFFFFLIVRITPHEIERIESKVTNSITIKLYGSFRNAYLIFHRCFYGGENLHAY
jgi:hypothetical protein